MSEKGLSKFDIILFSTFVIIVIGSGVICAWFNNFWLVKIWLTFKGIEWIEDWIKSFIKTTIPNHE